MKPQKITYIGSFPPPYGGVTVKNALLYKHLSSILLIEKLNLTGIKKLNPRAVCHFLRSILSRKGCLVLGVSADWRYRLTTVLYYLNRKKMGRSLLIVMGGNTPQNAAYVERMNGYNRVYVETESMKRSFERMGAYNVAIYPNCRERPATSVVIKRSRRDRMSSVYFSLISPEKGAPIVLCAAKVLTQMDFHFYGRIKSGYEEEFTTQVSESPNVYYHGVFDSISDDVIGELNKYDIHLFPTLCPNEGVPGVIAETKVAGVPTVASDRSFNRELIEDGVDGILTHEDTAEELVRILCKLSTDPERVDQMKAAALESSYRYEIERYLDWIVSSLTVFQERK